jgi:hypothetical protein
MGMDDDAGGVAFVGSVALVKAGTASSVTAIAKAPSGRRTGFSRVFLMCIDMEVSWRRE